MDAYFWGVVVVMLVGVVRAVWLHVHPSGRWGEERIAARVVGAGAYRSTTHYESRERRAPERVLWAGVLGRAWAVLTAFVFAPAGLLAALLFGGESGRSPLGALFAMATIGLALSGFALSVALVRAAGDVARRETSTSISTTLAWSHAHHALVLATFFAGALVFERSAVILVATTVLPTCAVGVAITALLGAAERCASAATD